jgi:hypothetical protein
MDGVTTPRPRAFRAGVALLATGLLVILIAVLYVLEVANGPGSGPKRFEDRRSYDQVKVAVHSSFPLGFSVAMGGLALAIAGNHLIQRSKQRSAVG